MTRKAQIILLCEDTQQETFLRRFLAKMNWSKRAMRIVKAPAAGGAAEQFVRERFPRELSAYRSKSGAVSQALVVMVDGDDRGVKARHEALDNACKSRNISPRATDERVLILVPTWRIETWLAYLEGETVDEAKRNYPKLKRPRECQKQVDVLVSMCRTGQLRKPAPPSLSAACDEYNDRLREA